MKTTVTDNDVFKLLLLRDFIKVSYKYSSVRESAFKRSLNVLSLMRPTLQPVEPELHPGQSHRQRHLRMSRLILIPLCFCTTEVRNHKKEETHLSSIKRSGAGSGLIFPDECFIKDLPFLKGSV